MSSAKYKGSLANERVGGNEEGEGEEEEKGGTDRRCNESMLQNANVFRMFSIKKGSAIITS